MQSFIFIVNSKDLFDKAKNPHLSLSPKDILRNPRIPKRAIRITDTRKKGDAG